MKACARIAGVVSVAALCGCTTLPSGPSIAVMPGPHKPFEVFQADDAICRDFAGQRIGINPTTNEQDRVVGGAVAGAALGAIAGAVIGQGDGEAIGTGAGVGALMGTAAGANQGAYDSYQLQERYDISYMQCMYSKGNQVPGYSAARSYRAPPPPPPPR